MREWPQTRMLRSSSAAALLLAAVVAIGCRGPSGERTAPVELPSTQVANRPPDAGAPRVHVGEVQVRGELDWVVARRVANRNLFGFLLCYEVSRPGAARLPGQLTAVLTVDRSGTVVGAKVVASSFADAQLEECVANRGRMLPFPESAQGNVVELPFEFQ